MVRCLRRLVTVLMLPLVAGCTAVEVGSSPDEIAAVRYVPDEQPYIAVVSMVAHDDQRAAHSALIISASQRVIYDPAGTFEHPDLKERGDIHYGADDRMVNYYKRYHARFSHFVHEQRIPVTPEVAEAALLRAQAQGPSPKMFCTRHTVAILNDVPGLPDFTPSFFPENLRREVASLPGIVDSYVYENDRAKAVPEG